MRAWLIALIFALSTAETRADKMPVELLGKSIVMSWTDTRTQRVVGSTAELTYDMSFLMKLYIGSQGHIFSSLRRMVPKRWTSSGRTDSEVSGSGQKQLSWRFEEGVLVADELLIRGARRVAVSFSGTFADCTVRVIYGKEGGASILISGYTTGTQLEYLKNTISSAECSVRQGNIFDGPQ